MSPPSQPAAPGRPALPGPLSASAPVLAPALLAAVLGAIYLLWAPASQDLAAATFRVELFESDGLALWNNQWYSGHHLLSYSVLYPPLGALLGVRGAGVLAVVLAAAAFAALAGRHFGRRALLPSLWFAAGAASWLVTGRMPFLVGLPFGIGAVLAADRGHAAWGGALATLATLASPVTGLFTGLVGVAMGIAGRRAAGAWLALGAGVPILVLNAAFPVGGEEPFVFSAFVAVPLLAIAVLWLVPAAHAPLRIAALLYAALALAVFVFPNPLGGNVTRLGALLAGPVLALVLAPRGRWIVVAVSLPLLYWQLIAPVRDVRKAEGDASTERAFYEPLLAELGRIPAPPGSFRIQIPPTKNRWEAAYVAPEYAIARGWLRQLEHEDFDLFTDGELSAPSYKRWLQEHAVSYVAVPEAQLDYLAEDEVALIEGGLPFLKPIWEDPNWRLYRVAGASEFGLAGRGIELLGPDRFAVSGPGVYGDGPDRAALSGQAVYDTSINWSSYWHISDGCALLSSDDESTQIEANTRGERTVVDFRFAIDIDLSWDLDSDPCSE